MKPTTRSDACQRGPGTPLKATPAPRLRGSEPDDGIVAIGSGGPYALAAARAFPGLKGMDLAKEVTTHSPYRWAKGSWTREGGLPTHPEPLEEKLPFHVVAYDYGVKRNSLRMLVDRGCRVTVVSAKTSAAEVMKLKPDGVFLSNGPGDPEPCDYAIEAIQQIVEAGIPTYGICLGHQLLGLASGAKTVKMKFGHHGANHPVQATGDGDVVITSQNHEFQVDEGTIPASSATWRRTFPSNGFIGYSRF